MIIPRDFEEFIELLNNERVKYLLVGGFAVAFHGYPRLTGDLDILIASTKTNALRVTRAVRKFGFSSTKINSSDFIGNDKVVQLGYPPLRIDIITSITGVRFNEAWKNRCKDIFGKHEVHYISKRDLIKNKQQTGRSIDHFDLERLEHKKRK